MRQEPEFFGEQELELLYIAKKLNQARELEQVLTQAGVEYAVEVDHYIGGFLFRRERAGAFFYVLPQQLPAARKAALAAGFPAKDLDPTGPG